MRLVLALLLASIGAQAAGPIGASYLNMKQIATPSAPSAGFNNIYFKSPNGAPYYQISSGAETQIGGALSIGTIDSQTPATNGLVVSGDVLYAQSASSTRPGLVNNSAQTLSGQKTFVAAPIMSALTASEVVLTDSSKTLTTNPYAFPATGSTFAIRDSSGNLVGNDLVSGITSVTSAAGTTVMTVASTQVQVITGTQTQNFNLPNATTLANGWVYEFNNQSTQNIVVRNTGASTLATVTPGAYARFVLRDNGSANGTWTINWMLPSGSSWGTNGLTVTGDLIVTGTSTLTGAVTTSTSFTGPAFISSASNPASAGAVRLANVDSITWRNSGNSGNNTLSMSTDTLTYSSAFSALSVAATNNLTGANVIVSGTVSGDALSVGPASQFSVTSGGSVGSGTWNATAISTAKGGTGQNFSGSTGAVIVTGGTMSAASIAGNTNVVKAPTQQRFTSGSGTYTTPSAPAPLYIKVRMAGGGGGGAAPTSNSGAPGDSTTFGTSLLTAGGGQGGEPNTAVSGGNGGTTTINSPAIGVGFTGGSGNTGMVNGTSGVSSAGCSGGANAFGGAGACYPGAGKSGSANTGAGGGGGAGASAQNAGSGGGAGGYIEAIITSPGSSYSYSVGAGGTPGGISGGAAGGSGAAGIIIVDEYYQ